jgi:dTDP-4-amino-4,6-dideoxygalactose transaminase
MVDTKSHYFKNNSEIDTAVLEVLESSMYIGGPVVKRFAENLAAFHGAKHVIPCANGTDALQISMMALGLKPGDEVITPSFTYIATVEAAAILGLKPVFVDVDERTFCINPAKIEEAITPRTKAIIPVHLYGHAADMEPILKIAEKYNLFVVEDNAQAIGNDYTFSDGRVCKTGTMGHIGTTSFYPSKNLGAYGDGGAMVTNDDALAEKLSMIAAHGQSKRYYHDMIGCNSRLDAIQAAILDIKLKYLNDYIRARRAAADVYDKAFSGNEHILVPYRDPSNHHVFHQYTITLQGVVRDALHQHLAANGVPSMIYYPVPCHKQKMFEAFGGANYYLPVTDKLTDCVISLPIHTELDEEQQQFIIQNVLGFVNR